MEFNDFDMKDKLMTSEQIAMMRDFYTRMTLNNSGCGTHFIGGTILLIIALLLTACTTTKYVPVETIREVYVTKTDTFLQKDSVFCHDSVYIHAKGDTVWFEKWHTQYKDRVVYQTRIDSFIKNDSIQVPYPVEKKLTKWQTFCIDYGKVTLGVSIAAVIALIVALLRWLRKRDK